MADTPLHTVANLEAHTDSIDHLRTALHDLAAPSRDEPGCLRFDVFQDCLDPTRFALLADWISESHHDVHLNTDHCIEAFKRIGPLLGGEVELRLFHAAD